MSHSDAKKLREEFGIPDTSKNQFIVIRRIDRGRMVVPLKSILFCYINKDGKIAIKWVRQDCADTTTDHTLKEFLDKIEETTVEPLPLEDRSYDEDFDS